MEAADTCILPAQAAPEMKVVMKKMKTRGCANNLPMRNMMCAYTLKGGRGKRRNVVGSAHMSSSPANTGVENAPPTKVPQRDLSEAENHTQKFESSSYISPPRHDKLSMKMIKSTPIRRKIREYCSVRHISFYTQPASSNVAFPTITPSTVASTITPSTITPSTITPSTITPSTITPSTVTPSTITPSTITPSTVTPSSVKPLAVTPPTIPSPTITSTVASSTVAPTTAHTASTSTHQGNSRGSTRVVIATPVHTSHHEVSPINASTDHCTNTDHCTHTDHCTNTDHCTHTDHCTNTSSANTSTTVQPVQSLIQQPIHVDSFIHKDIRPLLEEVKRSFPNLITDSTPDGNTVSIHRPHLSTVGPTKLPAYNPSLYIQATPQSLTYSFNANLQAVATGILTDFDSIKAFLSTLEPNSGFVICPGLPSQEYPPPAKRLKVFSKPLNFRQHENCPAWHIPKNRKLRPSNVEYNMCSPCKRLFVYLTKQPHPQCNNRTDPSSCYPESYLTPHQCSIRYKRKTMRTNMLRQQVKRLEKRRALGPVGGATATPGTIGGATAIPGPVDGTSSTLLNFVATTTPGPVGGAIAIPGSVGGATATPGPMGGAIAIPSFVGGDTATPDPVGGATTPPPLLVWPPLQ